MLKNQRGGAAIEFAIVLPLLALVLFGTIDFSLLFYNKQVLTNASREGARSAIIEDRWDTKDADGKPVSDPTEPISIIQAYCSNNLINLGGNTNNLIDTPTIVMGTGASINFIIATVTYDYEHLFSPVTGFGKTTLTGKTVMRKEWN